MLQPAMLAAERVEGFPAHAVADGEAGTQLPGVLRVKAQVAFPVVIESQVALPPTGCESEEEVRHSEPRGRVSIAGDRTIEGHVSVGVDTGAALHHRPDVA